MLVKNNQEDNRLSTFFGKCAMARLLEVFLNNPNKKLNVEDVITEADVSIKSIWSNMPYLIHNGMVLEKQSGFYKNYQLNTENTLIKQISKFRNILVIDDIQRRKYDRKQQSSDKKKGNRQINTKSKKKSRSWQSKNAGGTV